MKRRIGFLREDERELEDKKMRAFNHMKKCEEFAQELYQILLILKPNEAENVIDFIRKNLYNE
jgi:hypothetical protein